ncbi:MAG: CoA-binding protein [bacterium]|jgi:predicted CoA-binding protein|nr:CoA-binding protein [candidate division KSB1 bacterium]MDH7560938.1 CoA-binding protein [bacterium]
MSPEEVLRTRKVYALMGASQDILKYSYELFHTLLQAGYKVYPVNPRYQAIDGRRCYGSLAELPEKPEVVIAALAPANTERALEQAVALGIELVWIPPGSSSDQVLQKARTLGLTVLHGVCPVGTLRRMTREGGEDISGPARPQ